jgi:hypothetical protein
VFARASLLERGKMLRLKDPILTERVRPDGIELPELHEPESLEMSSDARSTFGTPMTSRDLAEARSVALLPEPRLDRFGERRPGMGQPSGEPAEVDHRMVLKAVKHKKSFEWVGSRSALPPVIRQMEKYGWAVTVREEARPD